MTNTPKPQANGLDEINPAIEQRLETSLRDVFFKGRRSMELEIETKGKAILLPISSEIKAPKSVLLQLITDARIDELEKTMPHTDGMRHYNTVLRRLAQLKENK